MNLSKINIILLSLCLRYYFFTFYPSYSLILKERFTFRKSKIKKKQYFSPEFNQIKNIALYKLFNFYFIKVYPFDSLKCIIFFSTCQVCLLIFSKIFFMHPKILIYKVLFIFSPYLWG